MEQYKCNKCGILKNQELFTPAHDTPRPVKSWCKECANKFRSGKGECIKCSKVRSLKDGKLCGYCFRQNALIDTNKEQYKCKKCNRWFPYDQMRQYKNRKGEYSIRFCCKKCDSEDVMEWRHGTIERRRRHIEYTKKFREKIKKRNLEKLGDIKSRPCTDCGQRFPPECMDFDHLDPNTKTNQVSVLLYGNFEKLLEEIQKCELVCANCHRIRTFKNKDYKYRKVNKWQTQKNGCRE